MSGTGSVAVDAATPFLGTGHGKRKAHRWVLSELSLQRVAAYKYAAGNSTPLELLLNHYWNWAVQWLPLWLAPNLVTLLGLCFMVASAALVVAHDRTLTAALPPGVALFCAGSLFCYQTLDAIDGKQARRTGTSSPLGQLFDHGCDALNTVFICTVLAASWRLGDHPWLMLDILFNIFFAFFMGQWEEYHTGLMNTNNGYVGITEGQVVQMAILLVTAALGAEAWDWTLFTLPMGAAKQQQRQQHAVRITVKAVSLAWGSVLTFWVAACSVHRVLFSGAARQLPAEEVGGKRLGRAEALRQLVPMALSFVLGGLWTVGHGCHVFRDHTFGVLWALGITMAYLSTRMIVCHMAKQPFGDAELLLPVLPQLLVVLNTYYGSQLHSALGRSLPLSDGAALWVYNGVISAAYAYYVLGAIADICHYLDVHCLTIHPRQRAKAT